MVLWFHGSGCRPSQTAYHFHIICKYSVLAHYYAVNMDMAAHLVCCTHQGLGLIFENCCKAWPNDIVDSWLTLQEVPGSIPHLYHTYTKCFSTLICCGWTYGCTLTL